ncbi:hypothetical protein [Anatilimnocola floriformis]|uniref:hypothetical protein n=1 Tax=Anatilimnocola floriformis TaxID=2948575 RepID=UPI0020C4D363|nr:hypothetical protein [Anatilimnocola floriformis]
MSASDIPALGERMWKRLTQNVECSTIALRRILAEVSKVAELFRRSVVGSSPFIDRGAVDD